MIEKIRDRVISLSASLLDAMKLMDRIKVKMLFVFDGEQFEGIFTIAFLPLEIFNELLSKVRH